MNKKLLSLAGIIAVGLIIIIAFSSSIFFTVQPGERAIIFKKFSGGLDKENVFQPGFNFKAPWNDLYLYDVKENVVEESLDVLDKNGLSITVDVSVRFHPKYDRIGEIQERFGRNYVRRLVVPEVRSTVRQVMGRYTAEEIYSTKRRDVESSIKSETEEILGSADNNIKMKALLIRSIQLPAQIKNAIENKLKQEQEALAYQFKLKRETSEAERRKIAANGEAIANDIVNKSLSEKLLKMRGIEATLKLANSPNTKVVIIGQGDGGLPLILGNQ